MSQTTSLIQDEDPYKEIFNEFAQKDNDYLTVEELQMTLNSNGYDFTLKACNNMFIHVDEDTNKRLDYEEFIKLMKFLIRMHGTFMHLDKSQLQVIKRTDLRDALKNLGYQFSNEQFSILFNVSDINNDNRINFEEFVSMSLQLKALREIYRNALKKKARKIKQLGSTGGGSGSGSSSESDELNKPQNQNTLSNNELKNLQLDANDFDDILKSLGIDTDINKTKNALKHFDTNHDEKMSFEEFVHFIFTVNDSGLN
ncbi:calmodulin [Anaeramoeba flamelloides]|uniref:Calmodulin n=1 Tax=Anaeramoeba flamelloides TaxID=1746091 RepID=A0AAV7ZT12_9EUKA|nr:calmodulin [Anaeramoeba flamelloides]KAJ6226691.1 calmodulin [Anaeramoeba flamelloides]